MPDDDVLDDLFHGCALQAYLEQAITTKGTPDSEATRRRAYDLYEAALAAKNVRRGGESLPAELKVNDS